MDKRFTGSLPIEDWSWQIGVIVGRSGTGKTTIAKQNFPEEYIKGFEYGAQSILDDFPKNLTVAEITQALCTVGLASPPDWLKPYAYLSMGERMRVDVARALVLAEKRVVFDEFTSVIDREVAKIASLAISKAVRKSGKQFIAVTCHRDILDWLEPDWVFDTDAMAFDKKKEPIRRLNCKSAKLNATYGASLGTIII
jgi:ABC-type dipeptide/oligopeptide/nickel transport system ATPase subunit